MRAALPPFRLERRHGVLWGLAVVTTVAVAMGLGAADITFLDGLDAAEWSIVSQWRAPRVVLGLVAGASLAVAGSGYQAVFRNPLADPYLLGAAAGAGLGATMVFVLAPAAPTWAVPVFAFTGAIVAVTIAGVGGKRRGTLGLILAGIAVSAFISALQTFLLVTNSPRIAEVYSWLIGRLSTAGWAEPVAVLIYVLPAVGLLVAMRRRMDLFHLDDAELQSLGINPDRTRLLILGAATLATAAVVAAVGLIGFVGLIIPHASRRLVGGSYARIVPVSAAMGAVFLVAADTFARTAFAPAELPVGVVTALAGAPAFVYLLNKT